MKACKPVIWLVVMIAVYCGSLMADANFEGYQYGPRPVNAMLKSGTLLYLGTDNGLMVKDMLSGDIFHYHLLNSPLKAYRVTCLAQKSNGSIWIGTDNGLFRMQDGVISQYMGTMLDQRILSLYVDQNDIIWLGSIGWDFYKINQSETLVQINSPGDAPQAICSDNNGNMWLGYAEGLTCWNPGTGLQTNYTMLNSVLPDDNIKALERDVQGNIWVLSNLGIVMIPPSGTWTLHGGNYDSPFAQSISFDSDAQGRLWIVKNDRILCLEGTEYQTYSSQILEIPSYPLCGVLCDDTIYYSAWGHLGYFSGTTHIIETLYKTELRMTNLLSVQQDTQNRYWVIYGNNHYTTIENNQAIDHLIPNAYAELYRIVLTGLRTNFAVMNQSIYSVVDGVFTELCDTGWVEKAFCVNGTSYFTPSGDGIYIHDGTQMHNLEIDVPGYSYNTASRLTVDQDNRLWFRCNSDLVSYADSTFVVYPYNPTVTGINCLSAAPDGNIWMGNADGEIWIFNGISYRELLALPVDEMIRQIVFGIHSEVWILTTKSLFVWNEELGLQMVIPSVDSDDLLRGISLTPDGRLIATTIYGYFLFQYVFPTAVTDAIHLPKPQILTVYPNPATCKVKIAADNGKVLSRVMIYNLKGQLVRKLCTGTEYSWDTTDSHGNAVPNGIYLIKAEQDGRQLMRKIVIRK